MRDHVVLCVTEEGPADYISTKEVAKTLYQMIEKWRILRYIWCSDRNDASNRRYWYPVTKGFV